MYLGSALSNMSLDSGKTFCGTSPDWYIKAAVENVEESLSRDVIRLTLKRVNPFSSKYSPCLEKSP